MCRARRDDAAMVRLGRSAAGWYLGRGTGRGAWCCAHTPCATRLSARSLSRALRVEVTEEDLVSVQRLWRGREGLEGS
ncbi:MAG: DUF448 domain-containing protein [Acidimicrobiales bacterium]